MYFAEGVPYASFLGRPLAVIPLHEIASLKRVCVDVPERNGKYSTLKNFQFEIFLHRHANGEDDDENNRTSKMFEKGEEKSYISPLKEKEIKNSAKKRQRLDDSPEGSMPTDCNNMPRSSKPAHHD